MKEMWNDRYSDEVYAYGKAPNTFFVDCLDTYKPLGHILLPAEGEGRNAVYAAKQGLNVTAFDISEEGRKKAFQLAQKEKVHLDYQVGDLLQLPLLNQRYDAVAFIFAHFPPHLRSNYHKTLANIINPKGMVFLEGFSQDHQHYQKLNPNVGGPKKLDMLYTKEMILTDFPNFEVLLLEDKEVKLNEGKYHNGLAKVIRFVGKKKD